MKSVVAILSLFCFANIYSVTGSLNQKIEFEIGDFILSSDTKIPTNYSEKLNYTTGGLTFNYPTHYFSEAPCVNFSLEIPNKLKYMPFISAYIVNNSKDSTTVFVSIIKNSKIEEADESIVVHLIAVENRDLANQ